MWSSTPVFASSQSASHSLDRQAHNRVHGALEGDRPSGFEPLGDVVRAGLAAPTLSGQVVGDLRIRQGADRHQRAIREHNPLAGAGTEQGDTGEHFMGGAGHRADHAFSVGSVAGLAEDLARIDADGVGPDDNGARPEAGLTHGGRGLQVSQRHDPLRRRAPAHRQGSVVDAAVAHIVRDPGAFQQLAATGGHAGKGQMHR